MGRLGVNLLLAANRLLPRPDLPGDAAPAEYARWEYDTSGALLDLWALAWDEAVSRALDLGCGLGGKTHRLWEHTGPSVAWTALDISLTHLRQAEDYHQLHGVDTIAKLAADVSALPFASASFDRIVTADTLEHFPDPRRALSEMRRCLRPGGRLILLFTPWGSPRGSHLADLLRLPWCQLFFDAESLIEAARKSAEEMARDVGDTRRAQRHMEHAEELVSHFRDHVHPTRIRELRGWLHEDALFDVEHEAHYGPGALRALPRPFWRVGEEWLCANFGVILRPRA